MKKSLQSSLQNSLQKSSQGAKRHRCSLSVFSAIAATVLFVSSFATAALDAEIPPGKGECPSPQTTEASASLPQNENTPETKPEQSSEAGEKETAEKNSGSEEKKNRNESENKEETRKIFINKESKEIETREKDGTVLFDVFEFIRSVSNSCKKETGDVFSLSDSGLTLTFDSKNGVIEANGRSLWCADGFIFENGSLFVPLSLCAKIVCAEVEEYDGTQNVNIEKGSYIESGNSFYKEDDILWLSRIIFAESRGEVLQGKIAVGNVVLNRVSCEDYPNTIYGVIFDTNCGIQFSPAASGTVYNTPDKESITAAKLCLEGVSISDEILYFLNPDTAQNFWITDNRTHITTIGNHAFYS